MNNTNNLIIIYSLDKLLKLLYNELMEDILIKVRIKFTIKGIELIKMMTITESQLGNYVKNGFSLFQEDIVDELEIVTETFDYEIESYEAELMNGRYEGFKIVVK